MQNLHNPITFSNLWDVILTMDEVSIINLLNVLTVEELKYIQDHLHKMAAEIGWHPSQKTSADFALKIIEKDSKSQ